MSRLTRRQLLAGLLGGLAPLAGGTVVLARSVLPTQDSGKGSQSGPQGTLAERADQVAADLELPGDEEGYQSISFVNGGFRNGGGGGFRNGGFANGGGGGGFRKGGFANGGGGGGFRNGGFRN
jgi:hypothetical protein